MITEERAEKALQFLVDVASELGDVRANRARLEYERKAIIAMLMSQFADKPLGVQEREAHAHQKYDDWLVAYEKAVRDDEVLSARVEAAKELIRLYQTQSANLRRI